MAAAEELQSVRIVSGDGTVQAQLVPDANMLCRSLTHRGVELLHPGRGVRAYAEHGKTMGIPLLYPWANRLSRPGYEAAGTRVTLPEPDGRYGLDPNGLPIHGALPGDLRWEITDGHDGDALLAASLVWDDPGLLDLFPFVHELRFEAHADDTGLQIVIELWATGEDQVPVSFGFHPYLVPSPTVGRSEWRVSLGASQRLVLDDHMIPTGATRTLDPTRFQLGDESWDDGLCGLTAPPQFSVATDERTVTVTLDEGYGFAQVYAPPGEDFICFEPMTAPTDALNSGDGLIVLAPGETHRARFSVTVTP
jgi:galactose mutarotase-like enzyme